VNRPLTVTYIPMLIYSKNRVLSEINGMCERHLHNTVVSAMNHDSNNRNLKYSMFQSIRLCAYCGLHHMVVTERSGFTRLDCNSYLSKVCVFVVIATPLQTGLRGGRITLIVMGMDGRTNMNHPHHLDPSRYFQVAQIEQKNVSWFVP
jgi:hypothetical protein